MSLRSDVKLLFAARVSRDLSQSIPEIFIVNYAECALQSARSINNNKHPLRVHAGVYSFAPCAF